MNVNEWHKWHIFPGYYIVPPAAAAAALLTLYLGVEARGQAGALSAVYRDPHLTASEHQVRPGALLSGQRRASEVRNCPPDQLGSRRLFRAVGSAGTHEMAGSPEITSGQRSIRISSDMRKRVRSCYGAHLGSAIWALVAAYPARRREGGGQFLPPPPGFSR